MNPRRVCVTGVGMVSPLGHSVESSWRRLLRGDVATRAITCSVPHFFPKFLAGNNNKDKQQQILDALPAKVAACVLASEDDYDKPASSSDASAATQKDPFAATSRSTRHQLFAEHAAIEAFIMSGLLPSGEKEAVADFIESTRQKESSSSSSFRCCPPERRGVNIGVGMNSLHDISDAAYHVYCSAADGGSPPPRLNKVEPFFVPKILTNTVSGALSIQFQLQGPSHCSSTACATGVHCIGDAFRWIQLGEADLVVCGATEAAISPLGIAGFSRMKALATKFNATPAEASRPFDVDRAGFVMGEGAGVLVLESEEHALRRGARDRILCEIRGYGMSGDGHHVSSPHPDGIGARMAMLRALDDPVAKWAVPVEDDRSISSSSKTRLLVPPSCAAVWHLNAHATSTPLGDEIELRAASEALRSSSSSSFSPPPLLVSSVKGNIGHLLGAAGAVETIFAIKSVMHEVAPATANLKTPATIEVGNERLHLVRDKPAAMPAEFSQLAASSEGKPLVLANSFGFGGTNSSLLLCKYE